MSKLLANQIANYGDDAPIEIKEGLNIPAGKPIQAAGSAGSSGQVLSTTGATIQWVSPFDGDYDSLTNKPTIPAAQVPADWNATTGASRILNKPVVPQQPSVNTTAAGSAALAYNSTNGEFTFTPPDLSSYATEAWVNGRGYLTSYTETDPVYSASAAANVTNAKITNWDAAYAWGNHGAQGYLTAEADTFQTVVDRGNTCTSPVYVTNKLYFSNNFADLTALSAVNATTYHGMFAHVHAEGHGYFAHAGAWTQLLDTGSSLGELADVDLSTAPTTGQVLKWDGSNWVPAADGGGGGGGISLTDISVTTASAGSPSLTYNNVSGVFTYTPPNLSAYLTSETDPVFSASAASTIASSHISNWDSAYGWGNHATAGYLTSLPAHTLASHSDVVTAGTVPTGNLLYFNGSNWVDWSPNFLTTESDPVFSASEAANITSTDTTNWDTAFGWGNHASAGYLTTLSLNGVSDVSITSPLNGQVLSYNNGTWSNVTPSSGGGASVTISDTAPAASAGDLWWESDTGRLKIFYQDVNSSQWVDASPPLADATSIGGSGTVSMKASLIPDTNDAYDIGSAEFKIRDLYVNDGSIHTESGNALSFHDGNLTWGGDDVIMLQDLKNMMATATSFEDFKNSIMGL